MTLNYFERRERLLTDYFRKRVKEMPDKAAIIFYGREVSFRELDKSSDSLAAAMSDMGYKKGDRIAEFMQNCPQLFIAYLAGMKLGLISVPIDPMHKDFELEYMLSDSGTKLVISMDQNYPIVEKVRSRCQMKDVIVTSFHDFLPDKPTFTAHPMVKPGKKTFPQTHEFLDLISRYPGASPDVEVKSEDYGWILYTSGTSGLSKGCLHTMGNVTCGGIHCSELRHPCTKNDITLMALPHTHVGGIADCLASMCYRGWTEIMLARWDAMAAMEAIQKYKVTNTHAWVTLQYVDIINHPKVKNYDLSSIRQSQIVPFAMPFTKEIEERWREFTGVTIYHVGYDATEFCESATYGYGLPYSESLVTAIPFPGTEIRIVDFETRKVLPRGEEGEIVVKSPGGLKEYWNKPEETKRLIVDGWVHTGDRGFIHEDGVLHFLGREKDIIKVSGYTVAPAEVELIGLRHPSIENIAVIGIPDPRKGTIPKAFVVLKPGAKENASDIEEWFKEHISAYKCPIVEIRAELPTGWKGEVLKRILIDEEHEKLAK